MFHNPDNCNGIPAGHRVCLFTSKLIRFHIADTTATAARRKKSHHWDIRHTLGLFLFVVMIGYFATALAYS